MYRYGFELEGFQYSEGGGIQLPHEGYPTDGFPGLIEMRTYGHYPLTEAVFELLKTLYNDPKVEPRTIVFDRHEGTFTPEQKRELRKRQAPPKVPADIRNIYGKKPRALGNKTIASLQINISNLVRGSYRDYDSKVSHPDVFGLLDVPRIVQALDKEFALEIKQSGRQPGEYCIKGNRLEYRSLPNSAFTPIRGLDWVKPFVSKVRKAVEGV